MPLQEGRTHAWLFIGFRRAHCHLQPVVARQNNAWPAGRMLAHAPPACGSVDADMCTQYGALGNSALGCVVNWL